MSPTLPPEVLQIVINNVCTRDDGTFESKRQRQRDLAALMSVSKVGLPFIRHG